MTDFTFSRKRDGTFQVEGCDNASSELIIPAQHEGRPVTSIADNAFSWCYQIRKAVIPETVSVIGESAFSWCESLEEVLIPDTVKTIGEWAFTGCQSLQRVRLPQGLKTIGYSCFQSCFVYCKSIPA